MGPKLQISEELHALKYRGIGESFEEAMTRIAGALNDDDQHFHKLKDILTGMRFLPAGRVQAAMGSPRRVTPYNCFVSQTIHDSMDGIMETATNAAHTMRMGGGIGYDFSSLRPRGAHIASLDSRSTGPVSFMGIFDALCKTIASAGHRRGAQMGVLRVDHPDIEEFIHAKQISGNLEAFNISVAVTDDFMRAVEQDQPFDLSFGDRVYRTISAKNLWEEIMRSNWEWAEPGVLFVDRINTSNNLWYCEVIGATNPCAEQPLPPWGACLLGSFNLTAYVKTDSAGKHFFDWGQFENDIPIVVRAMDNIVDRAVYPLPNQEREAHSKRRMGLGVTGLANTGEILGKPYASGKFIYFENAILRELKNAAYRASIQLAKEKGPFEVFNKEKYLEGEFIRGLDEDIRKGIKRYGIRNSHLLSVAPTGTISLTANNISSGLEPVFALEYDRAINTPTGIRTETVTDYAFREYQVEGKTSYQLTAEEHLKVLLTAQKHVDSAISKTCNVNPEMPWEEFKNIYMNAWRGGAKGLTTFNPGGSRKGVLNASPQTDENEACWVNPDGTRSCE